MNIACVAIHLLAKQRAERDFIGLAWLGLAWLGLAWLGLAWLGLAWLGLAWLGKMVVVICVMSSVKLKIFEQAHEDQFLHCAAAMGPRWPPQTAPLMATQTAPGRTAKLSTLQPDWL
jgi:hypothetical protein